MTVEQNYCIEILKNYLQGEQTLLREEIDWSTLKHYADIHQVSAIFAYQTKMPTFMKEYSSQLFRYVNMKQTVDELKAVLQGYPFIFVKGIELAKLYPVPALRTMGDVDILVKKEEIGQISEVLQKNSYALLEQRRGEWKYQKKGYLFEFHESLVHYYEGKEDLIAYFRNAWDYCTGNSLDWNYHLIYLFEHLRQHLVGKGVGFRQFMDIAVVCQKCNLDWEWIDEQMQQIGLQDFYKMVLAFNSRWFDVKTPVVCPEIPDRFFCQATEKIFIDGVFGHENKENDSKVNFIMYYQKKSMIEAKLMVLRQILFPPYDEMKQLHYCRYVATSKILLPIGWIHRIIYRMKNHDVFKRAVRRISTKNIQKRKSMMQQWGL